MSPLTVQVELQPIQCGKCGVVFAVSPAVIAEWKRSCQTWYCPNGHPRICKKKGSSKQRGDG